MTETKFLSKDGLELLVSKLKSYIQTYSSDNAVIVKGNVDNSGVLKNKNNNTISDGSIALGSNNFVGLKGWYYKSIYKYSNTRIYVYLSKTQKYILLDEALKTSAQTPDTSLPNLYNILGNNTLVSLINDVKYDNKFKVVGGNNGYVILDTVDGSKIPFEKILSETVLDPDDYTIYCLSKPDKGLIDIGKDSFSTGYNNKSTNVRTASFGYNNHSYGKFSFTEGRDNEAGYSAHSEGRNNVSSGDQSHTEGADNIASNSNAHAEGHFTKATGYCSHAEGLGESSNNPNESSGGASHVEGYITKAKAVYSHAEGNKTIVESNATAGHAEGMENVASGLASHVEGRFTRAHANYSHVEGLGVSGENVDNYGAFGPISHVEGYGNTTTTTANSGHAEGRLNTSLGMASHVEGINNTSKGEASHAEGTNTYSEGNYSHAEGQFTKTIGISSHAEGKGESLNNPNLAEGNYSHVEGEKTKTGNGATAAHAEGIITQALKKGSHTEGRETVTNADYSHAEGYLSKTESDATGSHVEGIYNTVNNTGEHAEGKYNISRKNSTIHTVGIGEDNNNRKNAYEITTDGKHYILGIGNYDGKTIPTNGDIKSVIDNIHNEQKTIENDIKKIEANLEKTNENLEKTNETLGNNITSLSEQLSRQIETLGNNIGNLEAQISNNQLTEGSNIEIKDNSINVTNTPEFTDINLKDFGSVKNNFLLVKGTGISSVKLYDPTTDNTTNAIGDYSFALGYNTTASGKGSHSTGYYTIASGDYSHAEGYESQASGFYSHAEGYFGRSVGNYSHAEGYATQANGNYSHSEGYYTTADAAHSHAEGIHTQANGEGSHAGGAYCVSSEKRSFTHGLYLNARNYEESAFGLYNVSIHKTNDNTTADATHFSIGIGDSNQRKNALEIKQNGDIYINGIGNYDGTNLNNSTDLASIINLLYENVIPKVVTGTLLTSSSAMSYDIDTTENIYKNKNVNIYLSNPTDRYELTTLHINIYEQGFISSEQNELNIYLSIDLGNYEGSSTYQSGNEFEVCVYLNATEYPLYINGFTYSDTSGNVSFKIFKDELDSGPLQKIIMMIEMSKFTNSINVMINKYYSKY